MFTPARLLPALAVLALATGQAQVPGPAPSGAYASDEPVTTRHEITIGDRRLSYTARAGLLPIRHNDDGEVRGYVFFVAYLLDRRPGEPARPLTFLWNGGPGSNSVLVHFLGFGPRRIKTADDPIGSPSCECELEDNESTWLDQTDLVFVDPVGTGFSRPTRREYADEFYNTLGDIASIAEFVRVYRTRFDAWDAPLFIGGESYGVWRAAGVAEALEQRGHEVRGVILISGGMALGAATTDEVRAALFVPTRTAAAYFHRKLAPDLQANLEATLKQAEAWAEREYAPALARRERVSDAERDGIISRLSRFLGLDSKSIDRQTLVVPRQDFAEQLLGGERVLARFDTRLTASAESSRPTGRGALVNRYLRAVLGFKTDLAYQGVEEGYIPAGTPRRSVNVRWSYNSGERAKTNGAASDAPAAPPRPADAPPGAEPWLLRAMALNPSLKAFVAAGLYDSLNSCALNAYIVRQLEPRFARNITAACYAGGHMMYEDRTERERLDRDVASFLERTLGAR